MELWGTDVGLWGTEVGLWGTNMELWGTDVGLWGTEVGLWGTNMELWGTDVGLWGTDMGLQTQTWSCGAQMWGRCCPCPAAVPQPWGSRGSHCCAVGSLWGADRTAPPPHTPHRRGRSCAP